MDFNDDIEKCLVVLEAGGLILYPTDTIWGIGCDATNEEAVKKVYELKERAETKSMIVLLGSEKELLQYITQPDLQVFDYLETVTKPTTVIYEGAIGLAPNLIAADGTVAIRLVKENFCRHLVKRFRKPIVSTSANISGDPAPAVYSAVNPVIRKGVDYIVTYRQEDTATAEPSSVVKWKNGAVEVLRP